MSRILLLQANPTNSLGATIAKELVTKLEGDVVLRDLMANPVPHITSAYADAIMTRTTTSALDLSEQLIVELEQTDILVITTPVHNFTLPSSLKAWVDHVVRVGRSFGINELGEKGGLLKDRPTYVIVTAGGLFGSPAAQQPDFLTPYMQLALKTIGIHSVEFIMLEGLVMGTEQVSKMTQQARERIVQLSETALTSL